MPSVTKLAPTESLRTRLEKKDWSSLRTGRMIKDETARYSRGSLPPSRCLTAIDGIKGHLNRSVLSCRALFSKIFVGIDFRRRSFIEACIAHDELFVFESIQNNYICFIYRELSDESTSWAGATTPGIIKARALAFLYVYLLIYFCKGMISFYTTASLRHHV